MIDDNDMSNEMKLAMIPLNDVFKELENVQQQLASHGAQLNADVMTQVLMDNLISYILGPPSFADGQPNFGRLAFDLQVYKRLVAIHKDAVVDVRKAQLTAGIKRSNGIQRP